MPKGIPNRKYHQHLAQNEDSLLREAWPVTLMESEKEVWHFKQFYALRTKALKGEPGVAAAITAQTKMMEIDLGGAARRRVDPGALKQANGLQEHLPASQQVGDVDLLGAVLKKRTVEGEKKSEDGEGE